MSADGTMVSDTRSGLVWQRGVDASSYSQSSAAAFCAARTLGGRSDWRLPTKAELQSIVDESRVNPAIDPTAFPATPSSSFWTATADVTQPGYGWFVDFGTGRVQSFATSTAYRVRCVR